MAAFKPLGLEVAKQDGVEQMTDLKSDQEVEVKFYVNDLAAVERRLQALGGQRVGERVFEVNLRFDERDGRLTQSAHALRLRQDRVARLTFKGPARSQGGVRSRQEIEFEVSDFAAAKAFLEALNYQVIFVYEKYRTTYAWEGAEVVLDELPYGAFVEIEGADAESIESLSARLGLDIEAAAPASYTSLFELLRLRLHLPFNDLTFENFKGRQVLPADMQLRAAD